MTTTFGLIVANGDVEDDAWLMSQALAASFVLAADGGAAHLRRIGYVPDIVIGDLDSVSAETVKWLTAEFVPIKQYSREKDETDLELAIKFAVDEQWQSIRIAAAGGGRIDQFLSNLLLLTHDQWVDVDMVIIEPHQSFWLFNSMTKVVGKQDDIISLIPLGGDATIRSSNGLQWPLVDSVLRLGPARGVSNRMTGSEATIVVGKGLVACCHVDGTWGR